LPPSPSTRCSPSCRASPKNSRSRPRALDCFVPCGCLAASRRSRCCGNGEAGITVFAGRRQPLGHIAFDAALAGGVAQVFFGLATGLIYYSSLFYAMDVGEASSEHGGLHEAFIGAGIFFGPATGAAALTFAPQTPNAFTWAVSALLVAGLGGLLWLRGQSHKRVS